MSRPIVLDLDIPLRSLRDAAGLTQIAMAEARGVAQSTVAESERAGERASIATLRAAAAAAGLELEIRVRRPE